MPVAAFSRSISNKLDGALLRLKKEVILMIDNISLILVIIGALNWGSIGIFGFDIVGALFGGQGSVVARIIFTIVGIAGLWAIGMLFKDKEKIQNH